MPNTLAAIRKPEQLVSALETLEGVHRALVDGPSRRVYLICEGGDPHVPVRAAAEALLAREGVAPDSVELQLSYLASSGAERRVRFSEMRVERPRVGQCVATCVLEWAGERFEGVAEGEGGSPGELRACAVATVRALELVLAGTGTFDLLGIKAIRIFDHDLVSVILRCPQAPDRKLVGASLVLVDMHRSAALAVLNATNRLLGNFLLVAD